MMRTIVSKSGMRLTYCSSIGAGQFGVASTVKNEKGDVFCLKTVRIKDQHAMTEAKKEVELMKDTCNHPNIVSFCDSWFAQRHHRSQTLELFILMEYCTNGSLDAVLQKFATSKTYLPSTKVMHYLQDLSSALSYCHDTLRILHRDLKPANILIDQLGTLKLADFGLSKKFGADSENDLAATYTGTPLYMAPEVLRGELYSYPADVWSLGCVAFELMALHSPFDAPDNRARTMPTVIARIKNAEVDYESVTQRYPQQLVRSVKWMLQRNASKRYTAKDIFSLLDMRCPPELERSIRAAVAPDSFDSTTMAAAIAAAKAVILDMAKPEQERLEEEKRATLVIQRQMRLSLSRKDPAPLVPMDRTLEAKPQLKPCARKKPTTPPKEEQAGAETIQKAFRQSLNRRRRPHPPPPPPSTTECSVRIRELATPRVTKPRLPAVKPATTRLRKPMLPAMKGVKIDPPRSVKPAWI